VQCHLARTKPAGEKRRPDVRNHAPPMTVQSYNPGLTKILEEKPHPSKTVPLVLRASELGPAERQNPLQSNRNCHSWTSI